jgi:hypothetical protein
MKKALIALTGAALAFTGPAVYAKEKKTGEEKLAEMIEGRVAGEPLSCIPTNGNNSLTVIDGTALVYKNGRTVYVNRTAHPKTLDSDDVLVIERFSGSTLCKLDQVRTVERTSGFMTGVVFMEDFVPYTKAG